MTEATVTWPVPRSFSRTGGRKEAAMVRDRQDEDEEQHRARQQRNIGLAIAVLMGVVVLLLVAIFTGATDAYQP